MVFFAAHNFLENRIVRRYLCAAVALVLLCPVLSLADNPPPVQTFYIPVPENDLLTALRTIENGGLPPEPQDPMYTYVTISVFSDGTLIYYDQWENGFDSSINDPLNLYHPVNNPGGTQIWGDDDSSNGMPPGFTNDVLDFGTVIRLENSVISSNRTVINFDGGDKIAANKPIAVTWAGWASESATLFAGAIEVFDTTFWGSEYLVPVGEDIATDIGNGVGQMFQYTGLSIMAGVGGATIKIDADADGLFEITNTLVQGEAYLVDGGVNVGARVSSDLPVQVDMLTGDVYEGYESRFYRLLPVAYWTSAATTPVSTPETAQGTAGAATTVWLYNPATNSIDVNYITRPGGVLTTNTVTVPGGAAGGYFRQVIPDGYGARFVNTADELFYALATINSTGTGLSSSGGYGDNRTWDWGFTLVPEDSLTRQVLVGLGIGRDPTSGTNPNENGAPIWVTPIGNGDSPITVYVDYDSDPSTGTFLDPGSNRYDAAYSGRELDILKIYRSNSVDQSGLLIYLLDDDVKLAAAWGGDPLTATAGAPGLDMGSGIPPLPQFVANKRSFLIIDNDDDGYISPGDILEYRIVIDNTGRQPVADLTAEDELPSALEYVTNTTFFINSAGATNDIPDDETPDSFFPLDEGGYLITNESALPVGGAWQLVYQTMVNDFSNLTPGTVSLENRAIVGGVGLISSNTVTTPIYSRVGDYVWWDRDGDGLQEGGEPGINGVTVRLLTTNGAAVLDEVGSPITAVTTNDNLSNPGWYRLTGITAGTYIVEFDLPSGYVFTTYNADGQGVDGDTNSTAAIPSGQTLSFAVAGGETKTTLDAGLVEESSIGDFVWLDADGDGIQDAGEVGLNGVTVNLLDSGGSPVLDSGSNPISVVTTNDGGSNPGYYVFDGLYAGDYIVEFVLPSNYIFTTLDVDSQGLDGAFNSDADGATGRTGVLTLGVEDNAETIDAGLLQGDLILEKTASHAAVAEGATVVYSITVSNAGPTVVTGITVLDNLAAGLLYVSDDPSQGSYDDGSGVWILGSLAAGTMAELEIEVTVDSGTMDSAITNTARITAADMPDPDAGNNQDSTILYVSSLEINKESDVVVSVQPGGQILYTITVTNTGMSTHTNISVTDAVPQGATYDPGSASVSLIPPKPDETNTVYDSFSAQAYTNNNGTLDWSGAWQETGEADGALAGDALVRDDGWAEVGNNRALTRAANLNGATAAELSWRVRHEELWETNNVRDEFNAAAYDNNNGSVNWSSDWSELGDDGAPGGGRIRITGGRVRFRRCRNNEGIERTVDLSGYASATLTFDWETGNLNNNEYVLLYVVTNGIPVQLAQYGPGAASGSASFDISAYITSATTIRFVARQQNWNNNNDRFFFDNIDVSFTRQLQFENNYLDNFGTQAYTNSDGTLNWNGDWTEGDPAGAAGPIGDYVGVEAGGRLFFHWAYVNDEWAMRSADLTGYDSAELRFEWEMVGLAGGQTVSVLISTNGSAPFVTLEQLSGTASGSAAYDISAFMSSNTTIRFENQSINWDNGDYAYFDAVEIIVRRPLITDDDIIYVEVTDDGSNWMAVYSATGTIGGVVSQSVDIAAYATADSAVRFRTAGYANSGAALLFDDVRIEYVTQAGGDAVGDPPGLISGLTLGPGESAVISFTVTVDDPLAYMAVTNSASVTSAIQLAPVIATVVDPVVNADLGLGKSADIAVLNEGEPVVFTITVTNLSADTVVSGVEVTDVYPGGFSYSNAVPGQGSFSSSNGVWSVGTLGIGASATLQLTLVAGAGAGGLYWTNTATISASDFADTNQVNNTASAVVLVRGADLEVIKTVDNPAPNEETQVTYTITVTNRGPSDTTGVLVYEPLTNGISYVSDLPSQGNYSTNTGVWTVGALLNGQAATLTITVGVETGTVGTVITNISNITASDQPDPDSGNDADNAVIAVSGLRVTKVSDVATFAFPGSNITYTIIVTNLGSTVHTGVDVTDAVPAGTAYVPGSLQVTGPNITNENFRDEFNAQSYSNNDGSLNWNGDWTEGDPAGTAGPVGNYVGVDSGRLFFHWAYVNDEWAMRSADLSGYDSAVYRFDWETVNLAGSETISVLISTNGAAPFVELAQLTGTSSGSAEYDITAFMSATTTIRFENLSINWGNGDYAYFDNIEIEVAQRVTNTVSSGVPPNLAIDRSLFAGESLTITFDVTVDNPCAFTQIVNTVSVGSDQQFVPVTATVADPVPYTDLAISKVVNNDNPEEGDNVVFSVTLNNLGPADASGVLVTDLLPAGLTYVTNSVVVGSYNQFTGEWNVGDLDSGNFAVLSVTASVDAGSAGAVITNIAAITANDLADPVAGNDSDDAVLNVVGVDIGVGKSVTPAVPFEKEQLVYSISVTNFGPDTATGVALTDLLPVDLEYVSHSVTAGGYSTNTGVWTIGGMAAFEVDTLTLTALVPEGTAGISITNTVTVSSVDQIDPNAGNDTALVVVVPEEPPLDILKVSDVAVAVDPGEAINYTITVTNQSSQVQSGVNVTDAIPVGVSFVPGSVNVYGPVATNVTVADAFSAQSFANNDGDLNWSGNWVESEGDGPSSGDTRVWTDSGRGPYTLRFGGASRTLSRIADLDAYTNATLSLVYRRDGLADSGQYVTLQISADGVGGPWSDLATFAGPATDALYTGTNFNIAAWISTNTAIRFISPAGNTPGNIVWFDDIEIAVPDSVYVDVDGGVPPTVASGYTLEPGDYMEITFEVEVDDPPTVYQITNSASVVSDQMSQSRTDTVIDPVRVTDLIIFKDISDTNPGTNEIIEFTITITNAGQFAAGNIEITEYWPVELIFSNALPSQGSYDASNHIWTVGSLAANAGATLLLTGIVDVVDAFLTVTNSVEITNVDEFDIDLDNNQAEIAMVTRVVVARFEAGIDAGGCFVEWETASENMTAGFILYRGLSEQGPWERANEGLLRARIGYRQGSVYRYYDAGLPPETPYWYVLAEIEAGGQRLEYGPFAVEASVGWPAGTEIRAEPGAFAAWARPSNVKITEKPLVMTKAFSVNSFVKQSGDGAEPAVLKIQVVRRGMHLLDATDLAGASGVSPDVVSNMIMQAECGISYRDAMVPVWRADDGAWLAFYAEPELTMYSTYDVYWLNWDMAVTPASVAPFIAPEAGAGGEIFFQDQFTLEHDLIGIPSLASGSEDDYWFWLQMQGGDSVEIPFVIDGIDPNQPGSIAIHLFGSSSSGIENEHWVSATLNSESLGFVRWTGLRSAVLRADYDAGVLQEETNTLVLTAHLDDVDYSYVLLQSVAIDYAHKYKASEGQLIFSGDADPVVTIKGFDAGLLQVVDITDSDTPGIVDGVLVEQQGMDWRVSINPVSADRNYLAWQIGEGLTPQAVDARNQTVDMRDLSHVVQYLLIAPAGFESVAQEWADYRAGLGLKTLVVPLQDVYDQFAFGQSDPCAIREMLRFASDEWGYAPDYVLLIGNGNYDYRGILGNDVNLMPPYMVDSPFGLTASDNWFADFDEDGIPEMAVGRLPVRTTGQLADLLVKIMAYESDAGDWWGSEVMFVSDEADAGGDFRKSSDRLMKKTPLNFWPGYSDIVEDGFSLAREVLLETIDYGCAFVNYFGHGAVDYVSNHQLLTVDDADSFMNGSRLPVITIMSCDAADFSIPDYDSLGERLLINPDGGAAAVWGPARESLNELAESLADGFYDSVLHDGEPVLGMAVMDALRRFADKRPSRYMLQSYVLLGDPALKLVTGRNVVEPYGAEILVAADWEQQVFTAKELDDEEISGWLADPDEDGTVNLLEYVLGRNPQIKDFSRWGSLSREEPGMPWEHDIVLTYTRRKNVYDADVFVEVSDDLVNWHSDELHVTGSTVTDDGNGVTETVNVYIKSPADGGKHGFMRLRARMR